MPLDLFSKTPIPDVLPDEMRETISDISNSSDKKDCLKKAYGILAAKYRGYKIKTYTKLFEIFLRDLAALWGRSGFLHCTNINYLLRILLVKSGFFTDDDIRLRWTLVWYISPHQYVQVKVGNQWINVDIWAHAYGVKLGDYARGFY